MPSGGSVQSKRSRKKGNPPAGNSQAARITFSKWATLMALFWAIEILLFTTFFTNPVDGLATGVVGSLGYWLKQQEVQRGSSHGTIT